MPSLSALREKIKIPGKSILFLMDPPVPPGFQGGTPLPLLTSTSHTKSISKIFLRFFQTISDTIFLKGENAMPTMSPKSKERLQNIKERHEKLKALKEFKRMLENDEVTEVKTTSPKTNQ